MRAAYMPRRQISQFGEKNAGKIPHHYVKVNGIEFDSQSEADRYMELLVLQKAGKISDLVCQPQWELIPAASVPADITRGRAEHFRKHVYTADFAYKDEKGNYIVEDVKSKRTREERDYRINRKLMWMLHGIYVVEELR